MSELKEKPIRKRLEESKLEEWQRGKELAKLSRLIENFKAFLPKKFVSEAKKVMQTYENRCEMDNYRKAKTG